MTRISLGNIAIDPRSSYDKLSRSEVRKILKAKDIKFHPGIKKIDGIKLLQANGIDPMEAMEWEQVYFTGPDGNQKIKLEPKRTEPRRPEGYDELALAAVDRASAEAIEKLETEKVQSLQTEVQDLKDLVNRLLDERKVDYVETEVKIEKTDLNKIHWKKFQKLAKDNGLTWKPKEDRQPIIAKLEGKEDVEKSPERGQSSADKDPDRQFEQPANVAN